MKIHDQLTRGLTRLGFAGEDEPGGWRRFPDHHRPGRYVFLGPGGAVRRGESLAEAVSDVGLKRAALNAGLSDR